MAELRKGKVGVEWADAGTGAGLATRLFSGSGSHLSGLGPLERDRLGLGRERCDGEGPRLEVFFRFSFSARFVGIGGGEGKGRCGDGERLRRTRWSRERWVTSVEKRKSLRDRRSVSIIAMYSSIRLRFASAFSCIDCIITDNWEERVLRDGACRGGEGPL